MRVRIRGSFRGGVTVRVRVRELATAMVKVRVGVRVRLRSLSLDPSTATKATTKQVSTSIAKTSQYKYVQVLD